MYLEYPNKLPKESILNNDIQISFDKKLSQSNNLIYGDNIDVLKKLLYEENLKNKVDLVYIDPPFATNTEFKIGENRTSTISSSHNDIIAYKDILQGFEFLEFLRQRLILIKELMSDKASIYLHIDYKIGHYVKIIMDEVFGIESFQNDITRIKCNPKNFNRKAYGNIKDLILFYTKTPNATWNDIKEKYTKDDLEKLFKQRDENGRKYTTIPLHAPGETKNGDTNKAWRGIKPPRGRHWRSSPQILEQLELDGLIEWSSNGNPRKKIYADKQNGKKKQDIWEYKDTQNPIYPTEKNLELIKNIILSSSDKNDLIMDCFCGSGGTLQVANDLQRRWIGIDKSHEAIRITKERLNKKKDSLFTQEVKYNFIEAINNIPNQDIKQVTLTQ